MDLLVNQDTGRFRQSYVFVVMFVAFFILAGGGYAYTNHVQEVSDHQWCEVLKISLTSIPSSPPPTAQQIRGRELLTKLARDKGCL